MIVFHKIFIIWLSFVFIVLVFGEYYVDGIVERVKKISDVGILGHDFIVVLSWVICLILSPVCVYEMIMGKNKEKNE